MRVMKFGGTSVAGADRLRHVASLVGEAASAERVVVVVSALAGVTDALAAAFELAVEGKRYQDTWASLRERHRVELETLHGQSEEAAALDAILTQVEPCLAAVQAGAPAPPARDEVLAAGERLSLVLAGAALREAGLPVVLWDTRRLVRTDSHFGEARVRSGATAAALRAAWHATPTNAVVVATGFIGADRYGRTTTLGRGGSDYTASLMGASLAADRIEIWTDVDGVLSAPPALAVGGVPIPYLDYQEALEIARFGGKVLHPNTMTPAARHRIPIRVRNTFAPLASGTLVGPGEPHPTPAAKAVSAVEEAVLLGWEGEVPPRPLLRAAGAFPCPGPGPLPTMWVVPASSLARVMPLRPTQVRHGVTLVAVVGRGLEPLPPAAAVRAAVRAVRLPVLATVATGSPLSAAVVVPRGLRAEAVRVLHQRFVAAAAPTAATLYGR